MKVTLVTAGGKGVFPVTGNDQGLALLAIAGIEMNCDGCAGCTAALEGCGAPTEGAGATITPTVH